MFFKLVHPEKALGPINSKQLFASNTTVCNDFKPIKAEFSIASTVLGIVMLVMSPPKPLKKSLLIRVIRYPLIVLGNTTLSLKTPPL